MYVSAENWEDIKGIMNTIQDGGFHWACRPERGITSLCHAWIFGFFSSKRATFFCFLLSFCHWQRLPAHSVLPPGVTTAKSLLCILLEVSQCFLKHTHKRTTSSFCKDRMIHFVVKLALFTFQVSIDKATSCRPLLWLKEPQSICPHW